MPNNKKHTLKNIKKRDQIHPYSRKAQQLVRVQLRKQKQERAKRSQSNNPKVERWLWFRFALDDSLPCASKKLVHELIDMYIKRNDEEIEKLEKQRHKRAHSVKSPRQDLLTALKASEENEYVSGFEIPELTDREVVKLLRAWDGDANGMPLIKKAMYYKADAAKASEEEEDYSMATDQSPASTNGDAAEMDTN